MAVAILYVGVAGESSGASGAPWEGAYNSFADFIPFNMPNIGMTSRLRVHPHQRKSCLRIWPEKLGKLLSHDECLVGRIWIVCVKSKLVFSFTSLSSFIGPITFRNDLKHRYAKPR